MKWVNQKQSKWNFLRLHAICPTWHFCYCKSNQFQLLKQDSIFSTANSYQNFLSSYQTACGFKFPSTNRSIPETNASFIFVSIVLRAQRNYRANICKYIRFRTDENPPQIAPATTTATSNSTTTKPMGQRYHFLLAVVVSKQIVMSSYYQWPTHSHKHTRVCALPNWLGVGRPACDGIPLSRKSNTQLQYPFSRASALITGAVRPAISSYHTRNARAGVHGGLSNVLIYMVVSNNFRLLITVVHTHARLLPHKTNDGEKRITEKEEEKNVKTLKSPLGEL